jgi:alkanesulfonate monooxygenase SsuD/methylene tetrahydromethanopterin reductase-like flavin-dependent oxidoreductase (luciferase family)
VQIPVNDPMMVVPVMAAVTEHIGFGVTANLTYDPPICSPAACRRSIT